MALNVRSFQDTLSFDSVALRPLTGVSDDHFITTVGEFAIGEEILTHHWIRRDDFIAFDTPGGGPLQAAITDRSIVNDSIHLVKQDSISFTDGFIANDTLRKLLHDDIVDVKDLFIDTISDLLDAGTGTISAILTDNGRALFTRFAQGEITFQPVEFRVGRGGFDPANFLQTLAIDGAALDLDDPIVTTLITNGEFDGNIAGWDDISQIPQGGDGSIIFNTDHMDISAGASGIGQAEQPLVTEAGALYHLEVDIAGGGTPSIGIRVGSTSSTEPGGGGQIHTSTQGAGTIRIGFRAATIQTWIGFTNGDAATTYELDNIRLYKVNEIQNTETPTVSTLAFVCRLTLNEANFGLGELGIWSEIKSSTTDANEVGTKILWAIAHHPVWAKTARNTIVHRVIVQI